MISPMTTARPQQRYDHRLRQRVQRTRDLTIATDLGVPRSTAQGWRRTAPTAVFSLEVADLTELELRQEVSTPDNASRNSRLCSGSLCSGPPRHSSRRDPACS